MGKKVVLDGWQARRWKKNKLNYRTRVFPGGLLEEMKLRQEAERTNETPQNDQQQGTFLILQGDTLSVSDCAFLKKTLSSD